MAFQKARVLMTNGGVFAVATSNSEFAVFSLADGKVRMGDQLSGNFSRVGETDVVNESAKGKAQVTIHKWGCSKKAAIDRICDLNPGGNLQILGEAGI